MAEFILKVGDSDTYKDGDIISAYNRRRIRCAHAEMIAKANPPIMIDWGNSVCKYRLERLGPDTALMIRTSDGANFQIVTNVPYMNPFNKRITLEHMDIADYFNRRIQAGKKFLAGTRGREIAWGGKEDRSHAALDKVWAAIEAKTPHREAQPFYQRLWLGDKVRRVHLVITVDDFDETTRTAYEAPLNEGVDGNGNLTYAAKRKHHIDWRNDLGLPAQAMADILNPAKVVDRRAAVSYERAAIVRAKPWPS